MATGEAAKYLVENGADGVKVMESTGLLSEHCIGMSAIA